MCLAMPGRVIDIEANNATVDFGGITRSIALDLVTDVKPGDYILAHAGFALNVVGAEEADEILSLFREIGMIGDSSESET
jgi:hydrogenase expression/formation protein HypC